MLDAGGRETNTSTMFVATALNSITRYERNMFLLKPAGALMRPNTQSGCPLQSIDRILDIGNIPEYLQNEI